MADQKNSSIALVLVHGGAGEIKDVRVKGKTEGVIKAARQGRAALERGGTAVDAVEAAINYMEIDESFNAGRGSVLTTDGTVENDAAIMDGKTMTCGSLTLLTDVKHPISAARKCMEECVHSMLGAHGAKKFVDTISELERVKPADLVTNWAKETLRRGTVGDTVGAVAVDQNGNLAAGTSTGGLSGKLPGRIGDSPIIGGGTYADNDSAAVSCTGHGESIMKHCVAVRTCDQVLAGMDPQSAASKVLGDMSKRYNKTAGLIVVGKDGRIGVDTTSSRMTWACAKLNSKEIQYGIERGEWKTHVESGNGRMNEKECAANAQASARKTF